MRLLPGMDGFFYLSFPGKQVYWTENEVSPINGFSASAR